jgi:hypothetical protein
MRIIPALFSACLLLTNTIFADQADNFAINAGLSGAWFNPSSPGQGVFLEVLPQSRLVTLTWLTWDVVPASPPASAIIGDGDHRWVTALGPYDGSHADLTVYLTTDGRFDDPAPVTNQPVGQIVLDFSDCAVATMDYSLDADGPAGNFPLHRIAGDNVEDCAKLAADEKINGELQTALDQWASLIRHHSVSAAVVFANGRLWTGNAGVTQANDPLQSDDLVLIASITKTMTSALILRGVDQQRLSLSDTIGQWLPPITNVPASITIRQLLNHTSGLANYRRKCAPWYRRPVISPENPVRGWVSGDIISSVVTSSDTVVAPGLAAACSYTTRPARLPSQF